MEEQRVCQGYHVIDSIRVGTVEVVLAHNPREVEPYVTWKTYEHYNYQEFVFGHYFSDEASARKNMHDRADEERESLPSWHKDKRKPPRRKSDPGRDR